jgi:hypothetical protein
MKKITLLLLTVISSFALTAQTLNQSANWPNTNWELTGNYDATYLTNNPTIGAATFSFNDDDPGSSSVNNVAATSPVIDLTAAHAAGETWVTLTSAYVLNIYQTESLSLEYWDADTSTWAQWYTNLVENSTATSNFCSATSQQLSTDPLNISGFSSSQLAGFRYRINYNDNGSWGWGFCFNAPTITSQTPPPCPNITNLNVTNVSTDSASVFWQAGNNETSWEIVVQNAGQGIPTGSGTATSSNNPYGVSDLNSSTAYEVYVRGYCGDSEYSNWIGPAVFNTLVISRVNFIQQGLPTGGGYDLAVVDMNGDFLDDVVAVSSNNVKIQQQLITGGFNEVNISTPSANFLPSWSMAAADFDANGFTDLLYGSGNGVTFMQANSDGTGFTQQSSSEYVFSQRSNFVDINNDGHLDAFVCHDVAPNVFYMNDGNGNLSFNQGGIGDYPSGGNYGSIWIDYDNDRDMDMFMAKCGGETARRTNQLLENNGDGTFTEVAATAGLADPMQTWSSSWGDYDNDGDMDVFVGGSSDPHKLMRNNGDGTFTNITAASGVSVVTTLGHENVSYDFDNDGNLDIACNGVILYGNGDNTFTEIDNGQLNYKNGSFGDLNNDGFIDTYYNGIIYMNGTTSNNWLKLNTVGTISNINGIGARVELHTDAGVQIRDVRSGEGFEYMSSLNTHFGIGAQTTINSIVIYWPSGIIDTVVNPDINTILKVTEGATLTIEDSELSKLVIYPNPVKDILTINTPAIITNRIATVFDINGKRILNSKLEANTLDVSQLQSGVYFLRLEANGKSVKRKFIKQ